MQPKRFFLALLLFFALGAGAQTDTSATANIPAVTTSNFLKGNLTALLLKNVSGQYERIVSKKISVALGFRLMPSMGIPFKHLVADAVDDEDMKDLITVSKVSNFAITPELRFYMGKQAGKGFYIAPYYRYAYFATQYMPLRFSNGSGGKESVAIEGNISAHTGGVLFGTQWLLGKRFCLDWWILGVHYGSGKGSLAGTPTTPLTPAEQNDIRSSLEDIDIPLVQKTVTVTSNRVQVDFNGAFGGLRSGISLGLRF